MNRKNQFVLCIMCTLIIVLCSLSFAGCSDSPSPVTANELHFSLKGISNVAISYDEEPVTFYKAVGDELVIKEYMTENKTNYHADVKQDGNSIRVSEGGKPFFKNGFSRYIEVYLPASYDKSLAITTTDGPITLSDMNLQLSALRIDSTAGTVELDEAAAADIHLSTTSGALKLGSITANRIRLDSTSGNVTCNELVGNVTYTSTSGNADIKSAIGSGSYKANNSGALSLIYTEVTGDLSFFNKNDDISLTLPKDLEFKFEAATKNGSLSTTFQEYLSVSGQTTHGTIGSNPGITVRAETKNGNIKVLQ